MRNFFVGYIAYDNKGSFTSSMSFQVDSMPPRLWIEESIKKQLHPDATRVSVISISEWSQADYDILNLESITAPMN